MHVIYHIDHINLSQGKTKAGSNHIGLFETTKC